MKLQLLIQLGEVVEGSCIQRLKAIPSLKIPFLLLQGLKCFFKCENGLDENKKV